MPYIRCSPMGETGNEASGQKQAGEREYTSGAAKCPMREAGGAGD